MKHGELREESVSAILKSHAHESVEQQETRTERRPLERFRRWLWREQKAEVEEYHGQLMLAYLKPKLDKATRKQKHQYAEIRRKMRKRGLVE